MKLVDVISRDATLTTNTVLIGNAGTGTAAMQCLDECGIYTGAGS